LGALLRALLRQKGESKVKRRRTRGGPLVFRICGSSCPRLLVALPPPLRLERALPLPHAPSPSRPARSTDAVVLVQRGGQQSEGFSSLSQRAVRSAATARLIGRQTTRTP